MPDWKTRYSTQLFAEKVMPRLRDIWPEYADDTRWWPQFQQDRVRPEETFAQARATVSIDDHRNDF
jgi:hypothetical protein